MGAREEKGGATRERMSEQPSFADALRVLRRWVSRVFLDI
jgi:hypothetical protein